MPESPGTSDDSSSRSDADWEKERRNLEESSDEYERPTMNLRLKGKLLTGKRLK